MTNLKLTRTYRDYKRKLKKITKINTSSNEEVVVLKSRLEKLNEEFISIRYKDLREYPPALKIWKYSFSSYSKATTNSTNAEKMARAAADIILNYYRINDNIQLNAEFLLDGNILNEMLILQKNRKDLVTDTKLKYLTYYKSFLTFIMKNPTSPENLNKNCNDLVLRNARLAQIDTVISDHKSGLLHLNKTEKAEKAQNKSVKFYRDGRNIK